MATSPTSFAKDLCKKHGVDKALDISQSCMLAAKANLSDPIPFYDEVDSYFDNGEFKTRINFKDARKRIMKTMIFWHNVFANVKKMKTNPKLIG